VAAGLVDLSLNRDDFDEWNSHSIEIPRTGIDRLFRSFGLMREKWDERRGAQNYANGTIAKAPTKPFFRLPDGSSRSK